MSENGVLADTAALTINIQNTNDAPAFGLGSYTASVNEEQSSGTALTFGTAVTSSDQDGDTPSYSLIGML